MSGDVPIVTLSPCHVVTPRAARGRGATPQTIDEVIIDRPNLFGRRKLRVRYRPLKDWTPDEICTATAVLVCYFSELGGFQTIDDTAMRVTIDRLRAGMSEEQCRWSIESKRDSLGETHEARVGSRRFVASPQKFFGTEQCETWLDKSPRMREAIDAANRAAAQRKAADPVQRRRRELDMDDERRRFEEQEARKTRYFALPPAEQVRLRNEARERLIRAGKLSHKQHIAETQVTYAVLAAIDLPEPQAQTRGSKGGGR